jgi:hypothetical protein
VLENEYIFKGILVVLNDIIEQNYINNKNKNITTSMFMSTIKSIIIKRIKELNEDSYKGDKSIKHYVNFNNILMNKEMFENIIKKLNESE